MKTKTSYDDCHPEIAKELKKGEHVPCKVWDLSISEKIKDVIVGYIADERYPYFGVNDNYRNAEPLPSTETRVISAVDLMKGLEDRGYVPDSFGRWNCTVLSKTILPSVWCKCGKKVSDDSYWEEWMLEEVTV